MKTKNIHKMLLVFLLCTLCFCLGGCGSSFKKAQKEAEKTEEAVEAHEPTGNIFKAMFSKKYVTKKNYEKMQKKNDKAQGKLDKEVKAKERKEKSRRNLKISLVILLVIIGVSLWFKFYLKPYILGRSAAKGAVKVLGDAGVVVTTDAHRSERLKADYPAALAKDCEVLGLNYDTVLNDFNGDAEKAYETIHVQALKKQYN